VGATGTASRAIFINSSRVGPSPRVGSLMLASMACPCQETERVSARAETANAPANATVKQTDILLIETLHWIEANPRAGRAARGYFGHPFDT
jgi:hypothetical protein